MKRWIHAADEVEYDEDYEWSPYSNGKYRVSSGYGTTKYTDNPKTAITYWYRMQKKNPMDVSIMCEKRSQAVDLCKAGTPELLTMLDEKYDCPYKLEYMIEECQKKVADGQKWFYEDKYGYGDSVHPFSVG